MASGELEPITGVWGRSPSGIQWQSPWWRQRGEALSKLKAFCPFSIFHTKEGSKDNKNLNETI